MRMAFFALNFFRLGHDALLTLCCQKGSIEVISGSYLTWEGNCRQKQHWHAQIIHNLRREHNYMIRQSFG